jgi:hypothetical protein
MKRALLAGAGFAVCAALYGYCGPTGTVPAPLPAATPGAFCSTPGQVGAAEGRVFICSENEPYTWQALP